MRRSPVVDKTSRKRHPIPRIAEQARLISKPSKWRRALACGVLSVGCFSCIGQTEGAPASVETGSALLDEAETASAVDTLLLDQKTAPPGGTLGVRGVGYSPGENVDVQLDGIVLSSSIASTGGSWSASLAIPRATSIGNHVVSALGHAPLTEQYASFVVRTNWTQDAFDVAGSGYNPFEWRLTPARIGGLSPLWSALKLRRAYHVGDVHQGQPVVASGRVYVAGADGGVHAFRFSDGSHRWQRYIEGAPYKSMAAGFGQVFVGGRGLTALDARTGEVAWTGSETAGKTVGPLTLAYGKIFVPVQDFQIFSTQVYDAAGCGQGVCAPLWSLPSWTAYRAAAADGLIISGGFGGAVNAYDGHGCGQSNCSPVWSASIQRGGTIAQLLTGVAVEGQRLFVSSHGTADEPPGVVYARDTHTGALLWRPATDGEHPANPAVADGVVHLTTFSGHIYALDAATGAIQWSAALPNRPFLSDPSVAGGLVYTMSSLGPLYAFEVGCGTDGATCEPKRTMQVAQWIGATSPPSIVDGQLFAADQQTVFAFGLPE